MDEAESKPWLRKSVDCRTLKDVIELWFKLHGKSLTAGEHIYDKLVLMVDALANPSRNRFQLQIVRALSR